MLDCDRSRSRSGSTTTKMTELEGAVVEAFLAGDEPVFSLLRNQIRCAKERAARFDRPFLGFIPVRKTHLRRTHNSLLFIDNDPAYEIPSHSTFVLENLAGRVAGLDQSIPFRLTIEGGYVRELTSIGLDRKTIVSLARERRPFAIESTADGPTARRSLIDSHTPTLDPTSPLSTWLCQLERESIIVNDGGGGGVGETFYVCMSRGATASECDAFAERQRLDLLPDLKRLWMTSSRTNFYGAMIHGIHDAEVISGEREQRIVLAINASGGQESLHAICKSDRYERGFALSEPEGVFGEDDVEKHWSDLEECFAYLKEA